MRPLLIDRHARRQAQRAEKDGQVVLTNCAGRVEGNVAVRATLAEIEALGPERAKAFLEGIGTVLSADKKVTPYQVGEKKS